MFSDKSGQRRCVITGLGPITCIGKGVDSFWNGILAEKTGIGPICSFDVSAFGVRVAGEIRDWNAEEFFPPHRLKRLDRYAQFAVASAKLALDDAGLECSREKPQDRIGVSFGTALGGVCKAEEQYIRFLKKGARGVQPTLALQVFGGSAHSNIAIDFGLRGVGTTNSNSCASGTVSVGEALRYIRDGFVDIVVAGGAEAPLLQSQQRRLSYDDTVAERRVMHPRDARSLGRCETCSRANRLHQRARQFDPAERCVRDPCDQGGLSRTRAKNSGEWNKGIYFASSGSDRRDRGHDLHAR